jgi:hypothetical protein
MAKPSVPERPKQIEANITSPTSSGIGSKQLRSVGSA